MDSQKTASDPGRMKRTLQLMVTGAVLLLGIKYFSHLVKALQLLLGVFSPFIIGGCIAFVLNVPMKGIEHFLFGKAQSKPFLRKIARPVSLILTFFLVILFLTVYVLVLVPQLSETIDIISASAQAFLPKVETWLMENFSYDSQIFSLLESLDWDDIQAAATSFLHRGFSKVLASGVNVVVAVISGLSTFIIGVVFSFYVLSQKEKLGSQATRIVHAALPVRWADKLCSIASLTHRTFSRFVRGQCMEAMILGLMFIVSMTILRLPYALLIGILIMITALIPIFGAFIGCVISALMILMVDPFQAFIFIILFLILQQLEGNLIYPHVVGNSVGLPSIWVLVAVTVGGSLMGIIGMLIFIPLTSVAYTLLREWTNSRNIEKNAAQPCNASDETSET